MPSHPAPNRFRVRTPPGPLPPSPPPPTDWKEPEIFSKFREDPQTITKLPAHLLTVAPFPPSSSHQVDQMQPFQPSLFIEISPVTEGWLAFLI